MKQKPAWIIPAFIAMGVLSSNAHSDYSRSFDGYHVFRTNCSVCHGLDGTGNGPLASQLETRPADLTNNKNLAQKSDRELFKIIEGTAPHGQVSSEMPQWGLAIPNTQIRALVSYVRYLHGSQHPVSGNPELGKKVYDDNCTICHGSDGKGNGTITKVFDMEPADHTDADSMNHMSNNKIYSIISNGTKGAKFMPGWKDVLSEKEIEDVISYIRLLSAE